MKKKWIAVLMLAAFSMATLAGCGGGAKKEGATTEKSGDNTVVVGTNPVFEPFEFQDGAGVIQGFDIDLMTAIGEDQGFKVEVKSMEFDALTGAIKNGSIDVIASGMSITPERKEAVSFSKPYMDASLGIVVDIVNEDIKSEADLKDKVVSAQIGTTGAMACEELVAKGGAKEVKLFDNFSTCIQSLKTGSVDAIINDMPVNQAYMSRHEGEVKILGEPFVADYYGLAVGKENTELLTKIDTGLDNLIKNGKYQELCEKYNLPVPESIVSGTAKA